MKMRITKMQERRRKRKKNKKKTQKSLSASRRRTCGPYRKVLSSRKEKNTEATTKVYDLNQKIMQALDCQAEVYTSFEDTWANVENEISEDDILFAEACEAIDELAAAQQHQARFHDELKSSRESLDIAVLEVDEAA